MLKHWNEWEPWHQIVYICFHLTERSQEYGISSFGISVTTLEEVFLKVGEGGSPEMDL